MKPKCSAVHNKFGEHVLICNEEEVAKFINAETLDNVVRKVNAHDALVAALVCAEADLEGLVESEQVEGSHPVWQTLKEIREARSTLAWELL